MGIDESDLVREIVEGYRDARMQGDKIKARDNGEGFIGGEDIGRVDIIYSQHIASVDKIRNLVELGRRYFPNCNTDWDKYDPDCLADNVFSWANPRGVLEEMLQRKGASEYLLLGIPDELIEFPSDLK